MPRWFWIGLAATWTACSRWTAAAELGIHVTDSAGRPLAGALAYALPDSAQYIRGHTSAIIDQIDKQFSPRISIVQTGTEIEFPNSDNIRHSVYSFSAAKPFTLRLYAGKPANPLLFDKAGLVVLGCNIHDGMAAWLLVVDTPYFGHAGADGAVTLHDLPSGHYHINVWYPSLPEEGTGREVSLGATTGPTMDFTLPVKPIDEQGL